MTGRRRLGTRDSAEGKGKDEAENLGNGRELVPVCACVDTSSSILFHFARGHPCALFVGFPSPLLIGCTARCPRFMLPLLPMCRKVKNPSHWHSWMQDRAFQSTWTDCMSRSSNPAQQLERLRHKGKPGRRSALRRGAGSPHKSGAHACLSSMPRQLPCNVATIVLVKQQT